MGGASASGRKKDGTWRPCSDSWIERSDHSGQLPTAAHLRLLNESPWQEDLQQDRFNPRLSSSVGQRGGYPKTAVTTPFGLFDFVTMPFRLRNATQTFQRIMNEVLQGLDFCYVDLLVASANEQKHHQHLRQVFQRLHNAGIAINPSKCVFGQNTIEFLGHQITSESTRPDKVKAILNFPCPTTMIQLRRFLEMVNYYRRHLKQAALNQVPLHNLLKDSKKNDKRPVPWNQETINAFQRNKEELVQAALFAHPAESQPLFLAADASDTTIGAALEQTQNNNRQPIAFFSKKLSTA